MEDIDNFLKTFVNVLTEFDKNILYIQMKIDYRNNLELKTTRFGNHFEDCPWSNDNCNCGPDTCNCSKLHRLEDEANKIMEIYNNVYNLNRCKNCENYTLTK